MRRNKGLVAAMSAVGVTLIVGMVTTTLALVRANQNAEQARAAKADAERLLVEYREELFNKALVASMTGDPNTAESISKASDAGVSDDRLEIVRGQLALYGGRAYRCTRNMG